MTREDMIAALAPSRLPASMARLSWDEMLALIGMGLLAALVISVVLAPLLTRRRSVRARIRATRGMPPQTRLLAIARILGHLPELLRPAAYGAAPPPSETEVERIALKARR